MAFIKKLTKLLFNKQHIEEEQSCKICECWVFPNSYKLGHTVVKHTEPNHMK